MIKNDIKLTEDEIEAANDIVQQVGEQIAEASNCLYDDCETDEDYELADAKRDALIQHILQELVAGFSPAN